MPRHMDIPKHLQELERMAPDATVQYSVKINPQLALSFIRDAVNRDVQPGTLLRDLLAEHYQLHAEGVALLLDRDTRVMLDQLAQIHGITRETAAQLAISRSIGGMLKEAESTRTENLDTLERLKKLKIGGGTNRK